jgi:hypothetical protein
MTPRGTTSWPRDAALRRRTRTLPRAPVAHPMQSQSGFSGRVFACVALPFGPLCTGRFWRVCDQLVTTEPGVEPGVDKPGSTRRSSRPDDGDVVLDVRAHPHVLRSPRLGSTTGSLRQARPRRATSIAGCGTGVPPVDF